MTEDAFDRFAVALWREFKLLATEPAVSLGEIVALLAILAYRPPDWATAIIVLVWLFWRRHRSDSDTRPKDGDAKQGSTRE